MSIRHIGLALIVLGLAACGAQPAGRQAQLPPAVTALIQDLKNQQVANPPAFVASYDYSGQVVYYLCRPAAVTSSATCTTARGRSSAIRTAA